ncbi:bifunctional DNA primase/helicase [Bartonella quintana]|uniref:Phage related protein n=1 Tax=Bartonella quintana (strain Toulouse) TaxID=283165 RepID=A0A0H3LWL1_BARQU|nr:bifunctional DNA primase/helicase [Bartonella quintana]QUG72498.1 toprim domain-containing protein [Bartonella quintana]CAF26610.1 phage related protein [Bartonella quintana str. Toulouse]
MSTIFEIKQKLLSQAGAIAEMLLPQGRRRGNDWIVGNTQGEAGQSLSVCLSGSKAGLWYDFAEGSGGDLLDLWCAVKGISLSQALEEARTFLNLSRPKPFMAPHRSYRRPPVPKGDTPQNLVKTYLNKERCIPLDILKRYRIGEDGEKIIFPFYKPDGTLALVKERLAQAGAKAKPTASQCEAILFGWQALASMNQMPVSTNHAPSPTNQAFASTDQVPVSTNHAPSSTNQAVASTDQVPVSTNHAPSSTNQAFASTDQVPISTNHAPSSTDQAFASTEQMPVSTNHAPSSTNQAFASTDQVPVSTNHAPSSTDQAFASTDQMPISTNHAPSSTDQAFASTDQVPISTDHALFPTNQTPVSTNRTIVITEGEIDALSLAAYGYPAVSVPFGGGSGGKHNWIENEFDHLESFETIFLATDMDKPGEEAARAIANRLGLHRCHRVRLPRKDANDCLTAGVDAATIAAAFSSAKSFAPEGLRRASEYKDQVIGLFWPEPEQHVGYTVPYPKLNGKLYFRPAELTLWSGASGAGKSQLLSDCIPHWIAQKSRLCLASLEMKGEQSLRRLTKQTGGLEQPKREMIERILDFLDDGLILYEHVGKSSVDTLLNVFDYCRARYGCDQFIIDSLMRLGIASDDYTGQEQAVYKMVDWAVLNAVHIHLVAHARKGGLDKDVPGTEDIKGASEIGANAFNIITIWRNRSLEDKICATSLMEEKADLAKRPGVIMNIAKQRSGDFEGKIGLWFDPQTYRYRCSCEHTLTPRRYLERPNKKNQEDKREYAPMATPTMK